ncbi:hypothetical protein P5673_031865 [Acropora cervicornis]|uniref:Uncharacterized protein n=1 Tax=Acropora cervicornis TaxID=6130 RepID=A0AAD9PS62_ACRCE|nr:hypothetical protein P5673_031865 [Acropora cervicornis]
MSEKYEETDFGPTAVSEPTKSMEEMSKEEFKEHKKNADASIKDEKLPRLLRCRNLPKSKTEVRFKADLDQRAVRDRYNLLANKLRRKLKDEEKASGIETEQI